MELPPTLSSLNHLPLISKDPFYFSFQVPIYNMKEHFESPWPPEKQLFIIVSPRRFQKCGTL